MKKLFSKLNEYKVKKILVFSLLILIGVVTILVALFSSRTGMEISFSPRECAFPKFFHLYCPGCGGTRAVRYLLKGDIVSSFMAHPIVIYLLLLYIQCLCMSIYDVFFEKRGKWHVKVYIWQVWGILVIVLGTFIFRNAFMLAFGYDYLGQCVSFWNPVMPIG